MTALRQKLTSSLRPYYVFAPARLARRAVGGRRGSDEEQRVKLLWGMEIIADPRDTIGICLVRRGIFDLTVCETLLRLADPGEIVVDAGANIGQMTSLLAKAVGPGGRVVAFEPHPVVFSRLARNCELWSVEPSAAHVELHQAALSDKGGVATLATDLFGGNSGSPSLERGTRGATKLDRHEVAIQRLDDTLGPGTRVGVMKVDVEGHEAAVLSGARALLSSHRVRDIVFEEHDAPPTPATRMLQSHGYSIMRLSERLRGPMVATLGDTSLTSKDDPSLLATVEPERAVSRLGPRGWAVYGVGPAAGRRG